MVDFGCPAYWTPGWNASAVAALRRLMVDGVLCERLRSAARRWVEENFDAHKNAARLNKLFEQAIAGKPAISSSAASGMGVPPVSFSENHAKSLTTPKSKP